MVHTLPDFTTKYRMVKIFANIDDAELAARTHSIDVFDRRGNVVWYDDFDVADTRDMPKWVTGGDGTGNAQSINSLCTFLGKYSLQFTAGSDGNLWGWMERHFPLPISTRMGIEFIFSPSDYFDHAMFTLDIFDGTTEYYASIQVDFVNQRLLIYDMSTFDYVPLMNYSIDRTGKIFYHLKFVVDFGTKQYVRLMFANQEVDISGYDIVVNPLPAYQFVDVRMDFIGEVGHNGLMYVGGVILTNYEP